MYHKNPTAYIVKTLQSQYSKENFLAMVYDGKRLIHITGYRATRQKARYAAEQYVRKIEANY